MGFFLSIHGTSMQNISTISGASLLEKENQVKLTEGGNRGEKMKNEKSEELNEEWIEVSIECPDCVNGRREYWKERKSGKPPWKYHLPCETCKGHYLKIVHQPKYCQIPNCVQDAKHKCGGVFCSKNGWVCSEHWIQEDIGYSEKGYVCTNCWNEVGSGGH